MVTAVLGLLAGGCLLILAEVISPGFVLDSIPRAWMWVVVTAAVGAAALVGEIVLLENSTKTPVSALIAIGAGTVAALTQVAILADLPVAVPVAVVVGASLAVVAWVLSRPTEGTS